MAEQLEIVIGANVDDAKAGIKSLTDVINDFARQGKLSIGVIEQSLTELRGIIKTTSDPTDLAKLNAAYTELSKRLVQLKSEAGLEQRLGGISRATRLAHSDVDQLSRSIALFSSGNGRAVDTISNLLFTFERLEGVTGSAKNAFASLVATFSGPAGIAIALSTAINLLSPFIEKLFETSEAEKKAAKQTEDLKKQLDSLKSVSQIKIETIGSVQGDIERVSALAQAVRDTNLSYKERIQALNELQAANKNYFGDITLETASLEKLTARVNEYTDALIQAAVVKGFENEISKVAPELGKLNKAFNDANDNINKLRKNLDDLNAAPRKPQAQVLLPGGTAGTAITQQLSDQTAAQLKLVQAIQDETKKRDVLSETLQKERSNYADLQDAIHTAVQESLKFKPLDAGQVTKGVDESKRKLVELAKLAETIFNVPIPLRFAVDDSAIQEFKKAQDILRGIEEHTIRLRIIVPEDIELPKLKPEVDKPFFKKQLDEFVRGLTVELNAKLIPKSLLEQIDDIKKKLNEEFKFDPKNITQSLQDVSKLILTDTELQDALKLSLILDTDPSKFAEAINEIKQFLPKELQATLDLALKVGDIKTIGLEQSIAKMNKDINKALNDALGNISTEGFASIGEAIGTALAGGDIGKVFEQFAATVGSLVEALGKQIIALGVAALLAKNAFKVLFANPAVAIAAGVALVAIGEAMKQLLSRGIQGFAKGGRPPVGEWIVVGERGPELMKFDQPGRVFSNSESQRMLSSSVSSSSVKEHETIREYLIATRVSQQVKEYFSTTFTERIKEGIRLSLVPIENRISETVKSINTNNDKLTAYTYRLHDSVTNNIRSLKESFVSSSTDIDHLVKTDSIEHFKTVVSSFKELFNNSTSRETNNRESLATITATISSTIEKLIPYARPSLDATIVKGDQSSHYENSFKEIERILVKNFTNDSTDTSFKTASEKITSSFKELQSTSSKAIDRLHESVINNDVSTSINKLHEKISERSDKSVTIERIINNNFFSSDSFKETFKSMSLTDLQKTFHIPAFAQGGAVFGPTLAILGEGFGINRGNPEFVGTRSQLSGIQSGQFDVNVNVDGELSFSMGKLAIALNREQRSSFRTSGKPPF